MDDADRAADREDIARDAAVAAIRQRIEGMPSLGYCYYCGEALRAGKRFCDSDCRDDYDRQEQHRKRSGQSSRR
jgi:hypothetical protein